MSAKRISSRARSVRKPEEEEAEAEGEDLFNRVPEELSVQQRPLGLWGTGGNRSV